MAPPVGGELVEDGGLAPVAVEAQVRHGQVGLTVGLRGEAHESVEEGARGGVGRSEGSELTARLHVDADGGLAVRGDGDGRTFGGGRRGTRVRDLHAVASPIGGAAGEVPAVNVLGEGLGAELVRGRGAGEVVEGDLEVPSGGAVAQVGLGPGLLGGTDHRGVHRRGRGRDRVNETRALLARGVEGTGCLGHIRERAGGAHDEVLDDVDLLARAHRGEKRIVLDALQHDGAHARHLRGRHGRAGQVVVLAIKDGRVDAAAGGTDLGLEAQVRGDAPRGEVRHRIVRARGDGLAVHEGQVMIRGRQHGLSVLLGDERGGHVHRRDAHKHERVAGDVVVDEDAGGLERRQVLDLLLESQLAARDQGKLASQAIGVLGGEGCGVFLRRISGVNVLVGPGGQLGDFGDLLAIRAARTLVCDVLSGGGEGVVGQKVVNRGDGEDRRVGGGLALGRGVGIRGVGQVTTGGVAIPGRIVVAGRGVDRNTFVLELLEDGGEHRVGLVVHAAELSEGQVHDVGVQDHHVVKGGEQRRVGDFAISAARDLRDDDLSLGGHADDLVGVTGGDAGDVRAVGAIGSLGRHRVVVAVRVVVGEGELLRDVHSQLSVAELRGQGRNLVGGERGRRTHGTRERRMGHFDASIDDGDDLALTLLGELIGAHHDLGAEVVGVLGRQSGCLRSTLGIDLVDVADTGFALEECGLDAAHRADHVEGSRGHTERESFESLVVLALHLG